MDTIQVLGQLSPAATTLTPLYTATAPTTVSSITICNTNSSSSAFRVSVQVNGAADSIMQYLYYDLPIAGNDTFIATIGITLGAGDIVQVQATNTQLAFSLFGVELS